MKKLACLLALALVMTACESAPPPAPAVPDVSFDDADVRPVAEPVNDFCFDLYAKLAEKNEGNLFFSPASISTALAMTCAGARGNTAEEMKRTLRFDLPDDKLHPAMGKLVQALGAQNGQVRISVANSLWGQKGYPFRQDFLDLTRKSYGAGFNEVDFEKTTEEARRTINRWVEEKTNDKIKDLIQPGVLDKLTTLVLTNAIHFKGTWKVQFDKGDTRKVPFHLENGKSVDADMMHLKNETFPYLRGNGFEAVELPYGGGKASMLILLPTKGSKLAEFEKRITAKALSEWIAAMRPQKTQLVGIPRFRMTLKFELAEILANMGMPSAVKPGADFSGMTEKNELWIDEVIHKAFVDVNEEGTEAAAATAVVMSRNGGGHPCFFADRPFLFLVRHNGTGTILFMGRVTNPKA